MLKVYKKVYIKTLFHTINFSYNKDLYMKYNGISRTKHKDGTDAIMVRFKYNGKTYPIKNFTKLFGCNTQKEAFNKLQEVKRHLSIGGDPFASQAVTINELYDEHVKNTRWLPTTLVQNNRYYNKRIRNSIGYKKIQKVTFSDLNDILLSVTHLSINYSNKLKIILNPIFDKAMKKKIILENPLDALVNKQAPPKTPISQRAFNDELFIAKELYRCIPLYQTKQQKVRHEVHAFFYMLLLSSHRYGELLKLTKDDIHKNKIISRAENTKTKVAYEFPLPSECEAYISSIENGLIFPNIKHNTVIGRFRRIIKTTNIKLVKGQFLTPHDTRRLFMKILINHNTDIILTDICLDHSQKGMLRHYFHFGYEQKVEIFNKYWNILREGSGYTPSTYFPSIFS